MLAHLSHGMVSGGPCTFLSLGFVVTSRPEGDTEMKTLRPGRPAPRPEEERPAKRQKKHKNQPDRLQHVMALTAQKHKLVAARMEQWASASGLPQLSCGDMCGGHYHGSTLRQMRKMAREPNPLKRVDPDLRVVTIPEGYPVPQLVGQKGVMTTKRKSKYAVLAEYHGKWMTSEEAEKVFDSTCLFDVEVLPVGVKASSKAEITPDVFVIDGGNGHGNGVAEYFNDFRVNTANFNDSRNDATWINADATVISYEGEPFVFFVAGRDIEEGEFILIDYGQQYWETILAPSIRKAAASSRRSTRRRVSKRVSIEDE
jgi:hypothetical protein